VPKANNISFERGSVNSQRKRSNVQVSFKIMKKRVSLHHKAQMQLRKADKPNAHPSI